MAAAIERLAFFSSDFLALSKNKDSWFTVYLQCEVHNIMYIIERLNNDACLSHIVVPWPESSSRLLFIATDRFGDIKASLLQKGSYDTFLLLFFFLAQTIKNCLIFKKKTSKVLFHRYLFEVINSKYKIEY